MQTSHRAMESEDRLGLLVFSAGQTAWSPLMLSRSSVSRLPPTHLNLAGHPEDRFLSRLGRARINFMGLCSITCGTTYLMPTTGSRTRKVCQSRKNGRTTSEELSVVRCSKTGRFSSFPTKDFGFACHKLHLRVSPMSRRGRMRSLRCSLF